MPPVRLVYRTASSPAARRMAASPSWSGKPSKDWAATGGGGPPPGEVPGPRAQKRDHMAEVGQIGHPHQAMGGVRAPGRPPAARPDHPSHLLEGPGHVGHVPHAETGHHHSPSSRRGRAGRGHPPPPSGWRPVRPEPPQGGRLCRATSSMPAEKSRPTTSPRGPPPGPRGKGKVARAAADIEHPLTGLEARQLPEAPLPVAPNAAGHDQVHPVVPAGDAVEEILNVAACFSTPPAPMPVLIPHPRTESCPAAPRGLPPPGWDRTLPPAPHGRRRPP